MSTNEIILQQLSALHHGQSAIFDLFFGILLFEIAIVLILVAIQIRLKILWPIVAMVANIRETAKDKKP